MELLVMIGFCGLMFWGLCLAIGASDKRRGVDPGPMPWHNEQDYREARHARAEQFKAGLQIIPPQEYKQLFTTETISEPTMYEALHCQDSSRFVIVDFWSGKELRRIWPNPMTDANRREYERLKARVLPIDV